MTCRTRRMAWPMSPASSTRTRASACWPDTRTNSSRFQTTRGQTPSLGLSDNGTTNFDSANLTEHQREITDFAILSLQKQIGAIDLQTSVFTRSSSLYYTPDPVGDLLFNGISQTAARSVFSTGEQTDASWKVNDQHTIRTGFQVTAERNGSNTVSSVLPTLGSSSSTTNGSGLCFYNADRRNVGPLGPTLQRL